MVDRERLVALLRDSATTFVDSFRGTTDAQFRFKPAADRWSIAETAEHVIVAETGSSKLLRGKLLLATAPPDLIAASQGAEARIDSRLAAGGEARMAPDFVLPTGRWRTPREMVDVFEESRHTTVDFLLTTDLDLTQYVAPHPAFGPINGYQWAYFLVRHAERHVGQIERVKQLEGYPDL